MEKVNRMAVDPFQVIFFNDGGDANQGSSSPKKPDDNNTSFIKKGMKASEVEDFAGLSSQIIDKKK